MRSIEVEGKTFKWKAGKRFLRIQGNGHSTDIEFVKFLKDECGITSHPYDVELERDYTGRERYYGVTPGDVAAYIKKYGWAS